MSQKLFVKYWCLVVAFVDITACNQVVDTYYTGYFSTKPDSIVLLPFRDVPPAVTEEVYKRLQSFNKHIRLLSPQPLPATAYRPARGRYAVADTLLKWLAARNPHSFTTLAITCSDISTTSRNHEDWGVIGLGQKPGKACIVSTFRLHKANRTNELVAICLHELGHTRGLAHCKERDCFMRDAEGHNVAGELHRFCDDCLAWLDGSKGNLFTAPKTKARQPH